jgi:type II secretory pathway pseudopilin PulG
MPPANSFFGAPAPKPAEEAPPAAPQGTQPVPLLGNQQPSAAPNPLSLVMQALQQQAQQQQAQAQAAAMQEQQRMAAQQALEAQWAQAAQRMGAPQAPPQSAGTAQQMFNQMYAQESPGWARVAAPMRQSRSPMQMDFRNNKFRTVSPFANQRPLFARGAGWDDEDAYSAQPSPTPFQLGG